MASNPDSGVVQASLDALRARGEITDLEYRRAADVFSRQPFTKSDLIVRLATANVPRWKRGGYLLYQYVPALAIPVALACAYFYLFRGDPRLLWGVELALAAIVAVNVTVLFYFFRFRRKLIKAIYKSRLSDRIEADPESLLEIYPATPLPWRLLVLGRVSNTADRLAKLLSANLDWYLGARKTNFRWPWVLSSVSLILWVLYTAVSLLRAGELPYSNRFTIWPYLTLQLFTMFWFGFEQRRHWVCASVLAEYVDRSRADHRSV